IYRKVYRDRITPSRVAELLILREDMPRSLHRCMNEVQDNLHAVGNAQSSETERRTGELHSRLHYGRIEPIVADGIDGFLSRFLADIHDLGERIGQDFLMPTAN
ncbi:MAG: alpha-E domain-containing protein, partial [Gammaproteobacteria bacterium]|nr:alpha-E domain-containing protein [Gammaproteobacteria bacterium]